MSVNDRLYDELLRPLADSFYRALQSMAKVPVGTENRVARAWIVGRLSALEEDGNRIADVLEVARPDWDAMRDLATDSRERRPEEARPISWDPAEVAS